MNGKNEPDWKVASMRYFDPNHEGEIIKEMAKGLSIDDICDFFGCDFSRLDIDSEDFKYVKFFFKQGRASGNKAAVAALFKQMDQRGGGQVALSYLARFADDWTAEVQADSETKGKKTFTVVLD